MARKKKLNMRANADKALPQVERMLFKLAWQASKTYSIPYDECLSECNYAFVKAIRWRHKPDSNTKFSTTVYSIAKWRLRTLVISRANALPLLELNEETAGYAPSQRSECLEMLEELSRDAQCIVRLIVESPQEIVEQTRTPKSLLRNVKRYLIEQHGKTKEELELAESEIRCKFNALWQTT